MIAADKLKPFSILSSKSSSFGSQVKARVIAQVPYVLSCTQSFPGSSLTGSQGEPDLWHGLHHVIPDPYFFHGSLNIFLNPIFTLGDI